MRPVTPAVQTPAANMTAAPSVAAVTVEVAEQWHSQDETITALADRAGPEFLQFAASSGVEARHLALPMSRCTTC
jgi:alkylresorcinol/alkylpyrone synthase